MLLPFSLKVVWFCLSLSGMSRPRVTICGGVLNFFSLGLLSCWVAMLAFGHALGAYELPLLYCIGCTLLEGSFCLGKSSFAVTV